jgi:cytoskeletal protein RodZ
MHESFSARLRRHREEQHIALVTIAEQTKIKLSLLEDLERDDISHWPAGIFRRAFIRPYANARSRSTFPTRSRGDVRSPS